MEVLVANRPQLHACVVPIAVLFVPMMCVASITTERVYCRLLRRIALTLAAGTDFGTGT
jgi:hypothetical protein